MRRRASASAGASAALRARARGLAAALALLVGLASAGAWLCRPAAARVVGEIVGPGAGNYPIAIPPLRDLGGGAGEVAARFADILGGDLALSGYFRVLDRDAYIDDPQAAGADPGEIEFHNWAAIGAMALVKGTLERVPDGVVIEVRLFDVQGRRLLTAKRYRAGVADLPRAAHRFADEVLRVFTGIRGPFDTRIVFVSSPGGFAKELYLFTFDAAAPLRITDDRTIAVSPTWSPDAERILFSSYRAGDPALYDLAVEERRLRQITTPGSLSAGGVWSPDGTQVAVTREIDGSPEIVILARDGTEVRRVTRHPAIDVSPSWSPDGREIAFCSDRLGSPQIFVAATDGSVRRLTYDGTYNSTPRWSPHGHEIAYTGRVGGRFHIFVVDARGGVGRQLTSGPGDNEDPSWSPDGRYLVFTSTRSGPSRLHLMDRTGRVQKQLTHGDRNDTSPAWSTWRN